MNNTVEIKSEEYILWMEYVLIIQGARIGTRKVGGRNQCLKVKKMDLSPHVL